MRVSVDSDDPGLETYHFDVLARGKDVVIRLDGHEVDLVITADDEEGMIVRHARDENGRFLLNEDGTEALRKTYRGNVSIELVERR